MKVSLSKCLGITRYLTGAVLLVSSATHIDHPYHFLKDLLEYRLVGGKMAVWASVLIPFMELAVAVVLISNIRNRIALGSAAFCFGVFLVAQWTAWSRGLEIDCGCFGAYARNQIGPRSLLIATGMTLLLTIGSILSREGRAQGLTSEIVK